MTEPANRLISFGLPAFRLAHRAGKLLAACVKQNLAIPILCDRLALGDKRSMVETRRIDVLADSDIGERGYNNDEDHLSVVGCGPSLDPRRARWRINVNFAFTLWAQHEVLAIPLDERDEHDREKAVSLEDEHPLSNVRAIRTVEWSRTNGPDLAAPAKQEHKAITDR